MTAEYGVKGGYGWLIGRGSQAAYGEEDLRIQARIENERRQVFADGVDTEVKRPCGRRRDIVSMPRYEAFTGAA